MTEKCLDAYECVAPKLGKRIAALEDALRQALGQWKMYADSERNYTDNPYIEDGSDAEAKEFLRIRKVLGDALDELRAALADSGTADKGEFSCGCRWWVDGVRCRDHLGHGGPLQGFEYAMQPEGLPTADAPPEPTEEIVEIGMCAMGYKTPGAPYGGFRRKFIKGLRAALAAAQPKIPPGIHHRLEIALDAVKPFLEGDDGDVYLRAEVENLHAFLAAAQPDTAPNTNPGINMEPTGEMLLKIEGILSDYGAEVLTAKHRETLPELLQEVTDEVCRAVLTAAQKEG